MGSAGCRDHGLGGLAEGSDAWVLSAGAQRRLPCRSDGSGRGSCGPADENPHVRVVVAGLQGLDHSRDPGRGRAVGDGVDHIAADPWIGIPGQLEQPRPHPIVVGPDVTGAQVPACELASPALLAPRQLQQSVDSILCCAPLVGRGPNPTFSAILLHRPTVQTIAPAGCPDHGLSRRGSGRAGRADPGASRETLRHAASMHNPLFYERQRISIGATDLTTSSPCTSAIRSGLHQVSVSRTACSVAVTNDLTTN